MKFNLKKGLSVLFIAITFGLFLSNVKAEGDPTHGFVLEPYVCPDNLKEYENNMEDYLNGCLSDYRSGDLERVENEESITPDSYVLFVLKYIYGGSSIAYTYTAGIGIDTTYWEYILDEEDDPYYSSVSARNFPYVEKKGTEYSWSVNFNASVDTNEFRASGFASGAVNGIYLEKNYDLGYFWLHLKKDARKDSDLNIKFTSITELANSNTNPVEAAIPFFANDLTLKVGAGSASDDATLGTLVVTGNNNIEYPIEGFRAGLENSEGFTLVVPNAVENLSVVATPFDTAASSDVSISGNTNLQVGDENLITIIVTAENESVGVYTIRVHRLSNDATLSSLTLNGSSVTDFNSSEVTYNETTAYATQSNTVGFSLNYSEASINRVTVNDVSATVTDNTVTYNPNVGANTVKIYVEAENCKAEYSEVLGNECTDNTYTINNTRTAASTDNYLTSLSVVGYEKFDNDTEFSSNVENYTLTVANDVTSVKISATLSSDLASAKMNTNNYRSGKEIQISSLNVGDNTFAFEVTAESGAKKTYTLNIYRLSNDKSVTITATSNVSGELTNEGTEYTFTYDPESATVVIKAQVGEKSFVSMYDTTNGEVEMSKGEGNTLQKDYTISETSEVTVYVVAEDNSHESYVITLERGISSNAVLDELTVYGVYDEDGTATRKQVKLSPEIFSGTNTSYTADVDANIYALEFDYTTHDENATFSVNKLAQSLNYGDNEIVITITAEDEKTTKDYKIVVTRDYYHDATLSTLSVTSVDGETNYLYTPSLGTAEDDTYTITNSLLNSVDKLKINATATNSLATIYYNGEESNEIDIEVGTNTYEIKVVAHDGETTKKYYLVISRDLSSNYSVSSVFVTTPFGDKTATVSEDDEYTYNVSIPYSVKKVTGSDIHVSKSNEFATLSKDNETEYEISTETATAYTFIVYAQDEEKWHSYTLNIIREKNIEAVLNSLTLNIENDTTVYSCTPNRYICTIEVPTGTKNFTLTPDVSSDATTDILESYTLSTNPQSYTINVTSQDQKATIPYTLVVNRVKSKIATLSDIEVIGKKGQRWEGSTTQNGEGFDPEQETYYVTVGKDIEYVYVTPILSDENASYTMTSQNVAVTKTDKIYLTHGDENRVIINTESEDKENPVRKTYYVRITRELNDDTSLDALSINGVDLLDVDEDNNQLTNYDYTVTNFQVTNASIIATPHDTNASYKITNTTTNEEADSADVVNLKTGKNIITVVVTAQNNEKKTYTLNVTRPRSISTAIEGITIGKSSATYDEEKEIWYIDVENAIEEVSVSNVSVSLVEKKTDYQNGGVYTVVVPEGKDSIRLVPGEYVDVTIKVTAEDPTKEDEYTLKVKRLQKEEAYLTHLSIANSDNEEDSNYNVYETFDLDDGKEFNIELPIGTEYFYIKAIAGADGTLTGDGRYTLTKDGREAVVVVTSENGRKVERYTVNVTRELSTLNNLTDLNVSYVNDGETIDADIDFNADDKVYTVIVPDTTSSIIIGGTPVSLATVTGFDIYEFDSSVDDTVSYRIDVYSESNLKNTYWVVVKTETASSEEKDATLANLYVTDVDENPYAFAKSFTEGYFEYTIGTIGKTVDRLVIHATKSNDNQTVKYFVNDVEQDSETVNLPSDLGLGEIKVEVESEDKTVKKSYTISYYRGNNVASVTSISINGNAITFDENNNYVLSNIAHNKTATINIVPADENATIKINGKAYTNSEDATISIEQTVEIEIISEDGTETNRYTITTYEGSNNADIREIKLNDSTITFDENNEYEFENTENASSVKLNITPDDNTAVITINGNAYTNGSDVDVNTDSNIEIVIVSEDGNNRGTYTIKMSEQTPEVPEEITSNEYGHEINDDYIPSVIDKQTADDLRSQLDNENSNLLVYLSDGTTLFEDSTYQYVGTGMIVKLVIDGNVVDSKVIVVKGDTNGDGVVDMNDTGDVINHFMERNELSGAYLLAGDTNGNDVVDMNDAGDVINYFMERTQRSDFYAKVIG